MYRGLSVVSQRSKKRSSHSRFARLSFMMTDVHPASLQSPEHQWMIKRSKAQKSLYEHAFRIRDAQIGFPIYPVYTQPSDVAVDTFAAMTKNTGFFGHLINNSQVFARKWHAKDSKSLMPARNNWMFEAGPPFWVNAFGRVVMHRARHFPTRDFWIREVLVSSNPRFFAFARGKVIRTAALADISTRPIVSESVWRKLVTSLEAKYSTAIVNRVLESLIETPRDLAAEARSELKVEEVELLSGMLSTSGTAATSADNALDAVVLGGGSSIGGESKRPLMIPDILTPSKLLAATPMSLTQASLNYVADKDPSSIIDVAQILSDPSNFDIRQPYDEARAALMSIANPAYVEAFIASLLGRAAALDWCPFFVKIFDTLRARSVPTIPVGVTVEVPIPGGGVGRATITAEHAATDTSGTGLWQEMLVAQHTRSYFDDYLVMCKELDAEILLAHMFQVVFGLDWGQEHVGLLCGNLDVRSALRFCPVDSSVYLYYNWRGKYYRVPTYGKVIKLGLLHMDQASVVINGQRHSSSRSSMNWRSGQNDSQEPTTSHLDLLRLGATMRMFYLSKQAHISGPQKTVVFKFVKMLDSWSTCISGSRNDGRGDSDFVTSSSVPAAAGSGLASEIKVVSAKEIDMLAVRQKCIDTMGEAQQGLCSWNAFVETPKTLKCPRAIPRNQQPFFDLFEIDPRQVPDKAIVYRVP
jgi:hypothetical protein